MYIYLLGDIGNDCADIDHTAPLINQLASVYTKTTGQQRLGVWIQTSY